MEKAQSLNVPGKTAEMQPDHSGTVISLKGETGRKILEIMKSAEFLRLPLSGAQTVDVPLEIPVCERAFVGTMLTEYSPDYYEDCLRKILLTDNLDEKIHFDMQESTSIVFYAMENFGANVSQHNDLRRQILRFFMHSHVARSMSIPRPSSDDTVSYTSGWRYVFFRLLSNFQRIIDTEESAPLVDVRDQRLLVEDCLAGWIGTTRSINQDFSYEHLYDVLSGIKKEEYVKIHKAFDSLRTQWSKLLIRYPNIVSANEPVTPIKLTSPIRSTDDILATSNSTAERTQALYEVESSLRPGDADVHKWLYPVQSIVNLLDSDTQQVVIHGVFSAKALEDAKYSQATATQLALLREFAKKGFTKAVMQLHEDDGRALAKYLGPDFLKLINDCIAKQEVHAQTLATVADCDQQLGEFLLDIAQMNKGGMAVGLVSKCDHIDNCLKKGAKDSKNIYIKNGSLAPSTNEHSTLRIFHHSAVAQIETQDDKMRAEDVIAHAAYELAKSYGWGQHNSSFIGPDSLQSLREYLEAEKPSFSSDVMHCLRQSPKMDSAGVRAIIITNEHTEF